MVALCYGVGCDMMIDLVASSSLVPLMLPSVSTFHPGPPSLVSQVGGQMANQDLQNHALPQAASSFSSSCGSSSSTTGSFSAGGGMNGGGCGLEMSSRCSAGSSSISGSNPRLNVNKTPIQTIPAPLGPTGGMSLFQVHDGFATVRKRKGPSAAVIAMRQREEIYDLAHPIIPAPVLPPSIERGTCGRASHNFMQGKGIFIHNGGSCSEKKSGSLLSTHPSLNLGNPRGTFTNGSESVITVSSRMSPKKSPREGSGSVGACGSPTCHGRPWPLSCDCPCLCSCSCHTFTPSQETIGNPSPSLSSNSSTTSSIDRTGNNLKTRSNGGSASLRRSLRRFVLPSKNRKSNRDVGLTSPSPPPPPSIEQFHSSLESVPVLEQTLVTIRKSPSASASLGSSSSQYYPSQQQSNPIRVLRSSLSDNNITPSSSSASVIIVSNDAEVSSPSPSTSSVHGARNFHRSCFLPKAPPLEPVMEDGIPWRQTRKEVPWWELAIRRGRYRSCPILQGAPQAHVVAAFEQSLSNMTQRLQTLTLTAEQKDSELTELRQTIDLLRKQSVEAGLTMAQMTETCEESPMARQLSADSVSSINSISSTCSGASHSHTSSPSGQIQMTPSGTPTHSANLNMPESPGSKKKNPKGKGWLRSSFTKAFSRTKSKSRNDSSPEHGDGTIPEHEDNTRQLDGDQRAPSFPPQYGTPPSSGPSSQGNYPHRHRIHRTIPNPHQQMQSPPNHCYHQVQSQNLGSSSKMSGNSKATSPLLSPPMGDVRNKSCSRSTGSHSPRSNGGSSTMAQDGRSHQGSSSGLSEEPVEEPRSMDELRKQLREKEMVLTDIRLEALTSAHQLESLKETVTKMRNEMLSLKQDNERLQRMVTCKSLTSSQSSLQLADGNEGVDRRLSASEVPPPSSSTLEMFLTGDVTEKEGKRIVVSVYLGCHGSYERYISPVEGLPAQECVIGTISVSNRTKWDTLDTLVKRAFKEYLMRIDPMSSLGLNADSVLSYAVGEVVRTKEGSAPELLPCGYLVGDVTKIRVCLKGAVLCALDALAFETLVPRSVLQRFMSLISDNGRIIICGPSGTGKSYLARKLGEYLVASSGKEPCPEAIASFSADHKNTKELRQYLANLAEQCDGTAGIDLPSVIILDNLHQIQNLGEVFNGVLLKQKEDSPTSEQSSKPIIIGTMTRSATVPPTAVHHNFRWVVFANHMEPVKGLLNRYLQRRLIEVDTQNGTKNLDLARIVDWIPKVWNHINKFLEAHNSGDVTIGPRLFLSCPMDVVNSQAWFADLWHYSVFPYLIEAVKEGLQQYGKRIAWEDPVEYLALTYPWSPNLAVQMGKPAFLQRIRPEDVGYDMTSSGSIGMGNGGSRKSRDVGATADDADPLMNMLLRLQEAASYAGPPGNDAESRSLDSRIGSLDNKDNNFATTA